MPLFRRRTAPAEFAEPMGTEPCSADGCREHTAISCAYRDRRGHVCAVPFCPRHWAMVGGVVYCRRHAGTITALGSATRTGGLPELENRGPSLINWIAGEIGPDVESLLAAAARSVETVSTETEVSVVFDQNRRRRWERSWKLIENTGVSLKVALQVAEDEDDALIDARVAGTVVARGVPPWVARRRAGQYVDDKTDDEQRALFRTFFLDHIAAEVTSQRATELERRSAVS